MGSNAGDQLAVIGLWYPRSGRSLAQHQQARQFVRRVPRQFGIETDNFPRFFEGVHHHAGQDLGTMAVALEGEFGHHGEIGTATPQSPEQVGVLSGASGAGHAVRGHHPCRHDVVSGEAEAP
jgi:hypothetical protein